LYPKDFSEGKKMLKEERAQTATEYLIIIGGAVAAATAVGLYLKGIPKGQQPIIEQTVEDISK